MKNTDRRDFLKLLGFSAAASTLNANIAKALAIPANNCTRSINDIEHIVILMQENRPFDHYFGTLQGVRGFNDPRAVSIHLPLQNGSGTVPASVFLQPAGEDNPGFGVAPNSGTLGGPAGGAYVIPPVRVNPAVLSASLGRTYLPGTDHSWSATHAAWNQGQYDSWASVNGVTAMFYMTRQDLPGHYALADAFTVGDAYHASVLGPTNPNRTYMWTGCIGNLDNLGPGGADGEGAGPMTGNGLSPNGVPWTFRTFPEVLQSAGVSWKVYQDLAGATFAPDFGDGSNNPFVGNFSDNSVLYFKQYADAAPGTPLFDNGCTGTDISDSIPAAGAPAEDWKLWQDKFFDQLRSDVANGSLPQVSWIVAPYGYSEHPDVPAEYGAWYISQVLDILVSNPNVFSKTALIINYDEGDGSFDHITPPFPPPSSAQGSSTVDFHNEIVADASPPGPIGLGTRVPLMVVSPWTKGGYVNSQVFDHTSVIQFIEKRFGVVETNISPWRRAVAGDLTSLFNFENPDASRPTLPPADNYLPPASELSGDVPNAFEVTPTQLIYGKPRQEYGVRPTRALPYKLFAHAGVEAANRTVALSFYNRGRAGAVFQVRSGNVADAVRAYTVEAGKQLSAVWSIANNYDLTVYGPNGFTRYFKGRLGPGAAALDVRVSYGNRGEGWAGDGGGWGDNGECHGSESAIGLRITNVAAAAGTLIVQDAYTGRQQVQKLSPGEIFQPSFPCDQFHGWYDLILKIAEDPAFEYRLAGHVETGQDSFTDPAIGGQVTLQT
jgi:phospholipase C